MESSISFGFLDYFSFFNMLLLIIGYWFMFDKSKIKKWWALVPVANRYHFALCADREDDAIVWMISGFLYDFFSVIYKFGDKGSLFRYTSIALMLVFCIINFIYEIRVYIGICQVYSKKALINCVGWMFLDGLYALIWGLSKKMQPNYIVGEEDETGDEDTGKSVFALKEGLTININKRTSRKGFKTKTMLRDIHLAIEPGKMVLLLGGSGAGKTTFLNAITGYEKADATIMLNGSDVYNRFDKMKYEIGFVPQQDLIRLNDTVYKTLMDSAALRLPTSISRKQRQDRVEEVMQLFGLGSIGGNIVGKQSGGQKKRISIATEYISDPSLFILDEPDSGLDGIIARELMERLHEISREGKIVIVITHTPDRVIDLFDQVIVLGKDSKRTGRLVYFGDIDDAKKFFERDTMEDIVKVINRPDEGGEGRTDELAERFAEGRNVTV